MSLLANSSFLTMEQWIFSWLSVMLRSLTKTSSAEGGQHSFGNAFLPQIPRLTTTVLQIMAQITPMTAQKQGTQLLAFLSPSSLRYLQPRRHKSLWIEAMLYATLHVYQIMD